MKKRVDKFESIFFYYDHVIRKKYHLENIENIPEKNKWNKQRLLVVSQDVSFPLQFNSHHSYFLQHFYPIYTTPAALLPLLQSVSSEGNTKSFLSANRKLFARLLYIYWSSVDVFLFFYIINT